MTRAARELTIGFLAPWRGLAILTTTPRLWKWAVLPFLITMIVFVGGIFAIGPLLADYVPPAVTSGLSMIGLSGGTPMFAIVYWTIAILAWTVAGFALLYLLWLVTRVLAAPFFSFFAEKVLIEIGLLPDQPFRLGTWAMASSRMFGVALLKAVVFGLVGLVLFVFSWIPGLGLFAGFGFLLLAAFDVVDFSLEALQLGFRDRVAFFGSHLAALSGFAMALGLIFLVPGLNFFLFPAAVAGGGDVLQRLRRQ